MLTPVLVQVYTRKMHFVNCIDSLSKCKLASQTHLYIASDAPKNEMDKKNVEDIREYSKRIKGFSTVEIIAPENNLGAMKMSQYAMGIVFSKYSSMIYTEDDNVFSDNFLEFMNAGLAYYKNNPSVFSICGHRHPFEMPSQYVNNCFYSTMMSPWGFGVWKDKYEKVNLLPNDYCQYRNKKKMSNLWHCIIGSIGTREVFGDAVFEYHCLKYDMVNVFPCVSLVRNLGFDGSGVHANVCMKYHMQKISDGSDVFVFSNNIRIDTEIERRMIEFIDYPFQKGVLLFFLKIKMKIKMPIRRFILERPKLKKVAYWILRK